LLLDEPAAGVPSSETGLVAGVVERLPPDIAVSSSTTTWTWCFAWRAASR